MHIGSVGIQTRLSAATQSERSSLMLKGWGAFPDKGVNTLRRKIMIGLTEAAVSLAGAASGSERASLISHRRGDFTTRSVMTSSFSWANTWRHCPKRQWRWFSKKTL